jgi:glycosyltransferase involved in cell wall biosynthesis
MNLRQDFQFTFTVFTPTYNRAALLPRVYECLEKQTFRNFEWLVVDDGSTDNTPEVIKALQSKASFPVRYVAKPNGGKPTAVNRGAREAEGYLFAILDSDDWFVPESLARFWHHWQSIPADLQPKFVGVTGLCSYPTGERIGAAFPRDVFDADVIDLRYKYRIGGEKGGILRTDVMRQFPYPENLGKYVSESLVWNRMAQKYQTRFVNEVLTIKEYQPGGITDKGRLIQVRDTQASLLCARELMALGHRLPLEPRVRAYANYARHSLHQGIPFAKQWTQAASKAMFCLCYPIGVYLKKKDTVLVKEEQRRNALAH